MPTDCLILPQSVAVPLEGAPPLPTLGRQSGCSCSGCCSVSRLLEQLPALHDAGRSLFHHPHAVERWEPEDAQHEVHWGCGNWGVGQGGGCLPMLQIVVRATRGWDGKAASACSKPAP